MHDLAPALNDDGDFAQKPLDVFDAGALFRGFHRCGHRRDIGKVQLGQAVDAMQLRRFNWGIALYDVVLAVIPTSADQNPLAQSRRPMDMIVQGRSMSFFQASQQWSTRSV